MPVDFTPDPPAAGGRPQAIDFTPEPAGTLGGIANSFQRGRLAGQRAIEAIQFTPEGATPRQHRRAFVGAMEDPEYMPRLMESQDDPAALARTEALYGPGRRVEAITEPKRQENIATAQNIAGLSRQMDAIPQSAAMQEWNKANNSNWWQVFARNPVEITANIFAESLPQAAGAITAGMAGGAAGGPVGSAVGAGTGSFAVEASNALLEAAANQGVNLQDANQVRAFFTDETKVKAARQFAMQRGFPIALFDALTAGVAGKFLKPALGRGLARVAGASGLELGTQMAGGAAGETAAQVASGQELSARDIAAEAIGELVTAPVEVASNLRAEAAGGRWVDEVAEVGRNVTTGQRPAPPADTSPDALASLQASLRGEAPESPRLKGAVIPKAAELASPDLSQVSPGVGVTKSGLTEEQRAAVEFQRKTDAAVAEALKNPDKDYAAMSSDDLKMLGALGDARALAEERRRLFRSREEYWDDQMKATARKGMEARRVRQAQEEAELESQAMQVPKLRESYAGTLNPSAGESLIVAAREAGGVNAPPLEDALQRMEAGEAPAKIVAEWARGGGEADALAGVLEQIGVAAKRGRQFGEFKDLAAAYRKAFTESTRNKTDLTLGGLIDAREMGLPVKVPESTNELIDSVWSEATATRQPELSPQEAALHFNDVLASNRGRTNKQNGGTPVETGSLVVGDTFAVHGVQMRVAGIDADTDAVTLEPVGGQNAEQFGQRPVIDPQQAPRIYPDFGTYRKGDRGPGVFRDASKLEDAGNLVESRQFFAGYVHVNLRGGELDLSQPITGWVLPVEKDDSPNTMNTRYGAAGKTAVWVPREWVTQSRTHPDKIKPGYMAKPEHVAVIPAEAIRPSGTVDWAKVFNRETRNVPRIDDGSETGKLEDREQIEDKGPSRKERQAEFAALQAADVIGQQQLDLWSVRNDQRVDRTDAEVSQLRLFVKKLREDINTPEGVDITGQMARTPQEVAILSQVFRNPQYEVLHWIFTKSGKVVGRYAVTARIPNTTYTWESGKSWDDMVAIGAELKADGFWLVHNHPSGNPSPSQADIAVTREFGKKASYTMKGHVIINHGTFSHINLAGQVQMFDIPGVNKGHDPFHSTEGGELRRLIGRDAGDPDQVARVAREVADQVQKGAVTIILTDARLRTVALGEIGLQDFRSESIVREQLQAHGLKQGASFAFAYYDGAASKDVSDLGNWYIEQGLFADVVLQNVGLNWSGVDSNRWFGKRVNSKDAIRLAEDPDEPAGSLRSQLNKLGDEMEAIEARGESIPQEMLDRYKDLADTLGDEIRTGRQRVGAQRAGRVAVDRNLQPAEGTRQERQSQTAATGNEPASRRPQVPQFRGPERLPHGRMRDLFGGLKAWRERVGNWLSRRGASMDVTVGRDAADNRAAQVANEASGHVRLKLNRAFDTAPGQVRVKHELREAALTFVVEADGDRSKLSEFYDTIASSDHADTKAGRQAMAALEYAEAHWDKLQPAAAEYRTLTETEREAELNEGVNSHEWRGGYVYHRWDKESPGSGADPTQPRPAGTPFRKSRSVATYAEGIAQGRKPQTLNALELLAERVASGQRRMNELSWVHGLRNLIDPVTDEPVVVDVIRKARRPSNLPTGEAAAQAEAAGETYKPEFQSIAPQGYTIFRFGDLEVAVQEGFGKLMTALTAPSYFKGVPAKKVFGFVKSALLLFDTFHLGRMVAWRQMFGLGGGYQKGQTLLDFTPADIREMADRGEIPAAWTEGLLENKRRLALGIRSGFNIGSVLDNSWGDALHHLPGIGTFNKWLFGQYQRGAMAEAWLIEFERMSKALPNLSEAQVARRVSRDLNARFGNLNRQGLFKSRTAQDLARFIFLAPQWNESLIRSELGAIGQTLKAPFDSVKQRRIVAGTLMKSTGLMAVGTFLANQVLNYAFRGKPTWENEEEGFDKKISAYIPDVVGKGPGFFLNPLALPAEYTHLIEGNLHRSGGDASEALLRIFNSRLHSIARAGSIFVSRRDVLGQKLRDGEVLPAMAKAMLPIPIAVPSVASGAKELITGEPSESYPGQFQKQIMGSFGVKTDQAPNAEQRVRNLARDFNAEKGIVPNAEFFAGDFDDFTKALRIGNQTAAREALAELLKKKTARQVYDHYKRWAAAPFTGQRGRESEFWRGLSEEQRAKYLQAREARRKLATEAAGMLRAGTAAR